MFFVLSPASGLAEPPPRSNAIPATSDLADKPNVVVIIADDLGYGETGMMGNREIPTPAIDALAASGVRCTSAYVTSSYCSPSRAGLMTGRYQSRFGYDMNPTGHRNLHPEAGLPESETTFVKRLAEAGYATSLVGKWHLGTVPSKHPLRRGFDEFYGFLHEGRFYVPGPPYRGVLTMIRDRSLPRGERIREGGLIRGNYASINEPAYDANNPVLRGDQVIVEADYLTDAITSEAVEFIRRHPDGPFCLIASYSAVHSPMQARVEDLESESLRHIEDDQRRIFAGMLVALDRGISQISTALRAAGAERKTLVVFLSDNGGPTAELTSSNAPLRDGKGSVYEGGLRVPMVWSMPGRLPAGRVEPRPVSSLDIAATALELAGLPADPTSDGYALMEWLTDPEREALHQELYWRMSGGKAAYRSNDWKVVRPAQNAPIELYDLASDLAESQDLAQRHPEKRQALWERWLAIDATMPEPIELPR
ncbi:MAG: n-acetylgalactosamine-4-sulfatase [Planctomycetaceae bacterium]|nr:MAG: n-acetylgalactosamine-4-sulfatase [Planctomycetaceae bacterium]